MKLVFAFLLYGFSASLASPTCDDSEAIKCAAESQLGKYPKTQEELDKFCGAVLPELDCNLRFVERCPNTLLGAFNVSLKMSIELYGKICEKDNPFRAMFLAKSTCLEEEEDAADRRCSVTSVQDYCQRVDQVQNCISEDINRVCGTDASELYAEINKMKRAMKGVFCITE